MADLKQALIWLADGKKVRISRWCPGDFIHMQNGIRTQDNACYTFMSGSNHNNWEIYTPPRTIEDDIENLNQFGKNSDYSMYNMIKNLIPILKRLAKDKKEK